MDLRLQQQIEMLYVEEQHGGIENQNIAVAIKERMSKFETNKCSNQELSKDSYSCLNYVNTV